MTLVEVRDANHPTVNSIRIVKGAWLALIWVIILTPVTLFLAHPESSNPFRTTAGKVTDVQASGSAAILLINSTNVAYFAVVLGALIIAGFYPLASRSSALLWLGAMGFSAGLILSSFLGLSPAFSPIVLRLPLLFTAVILLPPVNLEWFTRRCKEAIAAYVIATLLALVTVSHWVMQTNYQESPLPGWSFRLHSLGQHANGFAVLLLTYLILGWATPNRTWKDRGLTLIVLTCLIMTQSKTVWAAAVVAYMIRILYLRGAARFLASYFVLLGVTTILLILTLRMPTWDQALIRMFGDEDVRTFTGRTSVWEYTTDIWSRNPIFGYGPELWDGQMRMDFASVYGWAPAGAHNQFYQTLGESGVIGLAGLALFALILLVTGVHFGSATHGASLALILVLLVRCITEDALRGVVGVEFFAFFVTYSFLVLVRTTFASCEKPAIIDAHVSSHEFTVGGRLSTSNTRVVVQHALQRPE